MIIFHIEDVSGTCHVNDGVCRVLDVCVNVSLITKCDKHKFNRYSLLMHHDERELREFGLTDEMLIDQEW